MGIWQAAPVLLLTLQTHRQRPRKAQDHSRDPQTFFGKSHIGTVLGFAGIWSLLQIVSVFIFTALQ